MSTRGRVLTMSVGERLVTETCYSCGALFAMAEDFQSHRLRDRKSFYCPAGHSQAYVGKTDTERLAEAQARETAVRDQLEAAVRDAEQARSLHARDRGRIAKGVCPCCNRYFPNVHRHMTSEHPEFPAVDVKAIRFECSCGASFGSYHGLRVHQGLMRTDGWARESARPWRQHLTEGATR